MFLFYLVIKINLLLIYFYDSLASRIATKLIIEENGYQAAAVQMADFKRIPVEGFKVAGDKRSRLASVAPHIKHGAILFPKTECEDLIMQISGFGSEKHDDLMDAFVIAVSKALEDNKRLARTGIMIRNK